MSTGWIAAIAGYATAGVMVYKLATTTEDSRVTTPWFVPQGTEDWINEKIAAIQQEQKQRVEDSLMKAFGAGILVMIGTALVLGSLSGTKRLARRRSS